MNLFANVTAIAVGVLIVAALAVVGLIAKRLRQVPPNEALVIVGRGAGKNSANSADGQRVVIGGRVFVWPVLQKAFPVSLEQRQLAMTVDGVDKNFIGVSVKASVLFKVRGDEDGVRKAAQRFLSQQGSLEEPLRQALEGALRPILGSLTVETIISDRQALQEQVVTSIKNDLEAQGFQVDLVNLSNIDTPGSDYLRNLGRSQAANARQNAEVKEAEAKLTSERAQIEAAEQIAERNRAFALKQANIKAETDRAQAEADAAGQLARAEQDILVAQSERSALSEKAKVTEEQLDIDVRKPAEARAYAAVQDAGALRDAEMAAAEADAYTRKTLAAANRDAQNYEAEGIKSLGQARAAAAEAEGLAAAKATTALADALKEQGQAILAQQLIERLPEIVAAAAAPLSNIDNLTVVSTDGASALTKTVGDVLSQTDAMTQGLAGINLSSLLSGVLGGKVAAGAGAIEV